MGYGQAMSLPLFAQLFQALEINWQGDTRVTVKYADCELDPQVTSIIIGGPVVNPHAAAMMSHLKPPFRFDNLVDQADSRLLRSTDKGLSYEASDAKGRDCGTIVVWRHPEGASHIYVMGAKRLGVLAAAMLICEPGLLSYINQQRVPLDGSFQIVFSARADFAQERILGIDFDTIRVCPVSNSGEPSSDA